MSRASVAIKEVLVDMLDKHLPRRTKRLLFLASFFASVKDEKEPSFDDPALQKLNQLMRLSNTDSALKLPVHLSRVIWRGRTFNEGNSRLTDWTQPRTRSSPTCRCGCGTADLKISKKTSSSCSCIVKSLPSVKQHVPA
jgi:hypothetical protein